MTENISSQVETNNNDETETTNFICLDKEELLQKLYKLNEDNLLLSEQLKQYRKIIELIESKMNDINSTNNEKRERIYGIIQNIKKLIQTGGSRKKSKKHTKRRSKRSKQHSKRSKRHRSKTR